MLQKSSMDKTLEIFFISPTKNHYLMEISRQVKIAHTSVKRNLDELVKKNLIIVLIEKKGNRKFPFYKANLDNKDFKKLKKIYNISMLLKSNLIEYIEKEIMPKSTILFGSYQRGEDTEESDIDLFIESKPLDLNLNLYEKKLKRKIQLHFNENFNLYSKELKNNIINGIVLSGFLEGYK